MEALSYGRDGRAPRRRSEGAVQSVAGFASLHVAITLLVALMVQYTLRNRILHIVFWANFAITVVATLYFGWHYIADDLAGVVIALFSFWLGGLASGQKFDRHGLASHPTSTTSPGPRRRRVSGVRRSAPRCRRDPRVPGEPRGSRPKFRGGGSSSPGDTGRPRLTQRSNAAVR